MAPEAEDLARMLSSESSNPKAQTVIGWISVQAARTGWMSVFRLLTGSSGQYGHQITSCPTATPSQARTHPVMFNERTVTFETTRRGVQEMLVREPG